MKRGGAARRVLLLACAVLALLTPLPLQAQAPPATPPDASASCDSDMDGAAVGTVAGFAGGFLIGGLLGGGEMFPAPLVGAAGAFAGFWGGLLHDSGDCDLPENGRRESDDPREQSYHDPEVAWRLATG